MTADTKPRNAPPAPRKARGKRAATVRATSIGKPPLSAAAAFARLLAQVITKSR